MASKSDFNRQLSQSWVLILLIFGSVVGWYFLANMDEPMRWRPDFPQLKDDPSGLSFSMIFFMWSIMMIAMMLPSALVMVHMLSKVFRNMPGHNDSALLTLIFTAGYLFVWIGFSLGASIIQWLLQITSSLSTKLAFTSAALSGMVLIAAGIYQWTALKQTCLNICRSPMSFLMLHWMEGPAGSLKMGLKHGMYCVGCCWLLMMVMFVGGVMGFYWMVGIATYVLLEKIVPHGELISRMGGVLMGLSGIFWFYQI